MSMFYEFTAKLWKRSEADKASRYFITVDPQISDTLKQYAITIPRKWRWSLRVEAMIGYLKWKTSIFPDKKSGCYVLPIKSQIRRALQLDEGSTCHLSLSILS